MASEKAKLAGTPPSRSSILQIPLVNKMKRKRANSEESSATRVEQSPLESQQDNMEWSAEHSKSQLQQQQPTGSDDLLAHRWPRNSDKITGLAATACNVASKVPTVGMFDDKASDNVRGWLTFIADQILQRLRLSKISKRNLALKSS